jgi:hypothetical protein
MPEEGTRLEQSNGESGIDGTVPDSDLHFCAPVLRLSARIVRQAAAVPQQARILKTLLFELGPFVTLMFIADKLLERLTRARVILVQLREPAQLADLEARLPAGYTADVRTPATIGRLADDCAAQLSARFLAGASINGDRCVAISIDDSVVSFQWLSTGLTWAYDDIWISFGPKYLYGYNSFTAPAHRGRQLNRSGVVTAAQLLAIPDRRGLAGYIMAGNVSSLLAHARVAPGHAGFAVVWPRGDSKLRVFASPGCRRGGLQLARQ